MNPAQRAGSASVAAPVAILLCAGYGTRMGELTRTVPKPLLEVAGRPVLDYLVDQLSELEGLSALHVVTNGVYADAFRRWAEDRRRRWTVAGRTLHVHDDGSTRAENRLGAVGDLRFVLDRASAEGGALVAAGDNIFRVSLRPFWRRFLERSAERAEVPAAVPSVVLALEERDPAKLRRTGVLELDGRRVVALHEKPADPPSRWACPSCYALAPAALALVGSYLDAGGAGDEIGRFVAHVVDSTEVEADTLPAGDGEFRLHVGNPRELERADRILRAEAVISEAAG